MTYTIAECTVQWITPDDGQRNCPKHVEFHFQNKFEKLVHLVGFTIRKFVTMRGHMNVKKLGLYCWQQYEILCCSTTVQRETIFASPWQHTAVLILLISPCRSPAIRKIKIFSLARQLWLCQGTILLSHTYTSCFIFKVLWLHYKVHVINSLTNVNLKHLKPQISFPLDATLSSLYCISYRITLHVSGALCAHQEF
jgi:hypothetical protein